MRTIVYFLSFLFVFHISSAQAEPNYDESKVPVFPIPNLLMTHSGEKIKTSKEWLDKYRPELLNFFENNVYGKVPGKFDGTSIKVLEQDDNALNGKAKRRQIELTFEKNNKSLSITLLLYIPKNVKKAPIFLGYNFYGNHTITEDAKVIISSAWAMDNKTFGITNHQLSAESRGARTNRWAIEKIIDGGFGLATIYYGEVDPDKNDLSDGIHSLFYGQDQLEPNPDEWGSISAWSWGLSRAMDYFEEDIEIDSSKVIVFGHSRLGKVALWAGATDKRFAAVISNNSGCGGAALSKRKFGETIAHINTSFPHWFCGNFESYSDNEEDLPVDQHQLLALIAPRPLYVASAEEDEWADPKGEFLSAHYASSVYKLFGKDGITSNKMPATNQPIQNTVAYHIRSGKHDVTDYDWEQYVTWAKVYVIKMGN